MFIGPSHFGPSSYIFFGDFDGLEKETPTTDVASQTPSNYLNTDQIIENLCISVTDYHMRSKVLALLHL